MTAEKLNHPSFNKFKEMIIRTLLLTTYLAAWFCALVFLSDSILEIDGVPYIGFGMAIIKAAVTAKFMIMGLEIFPLPINKSSSLVFGVLKRSIVYVVVVVALSYLFAGIEGYFHHEGFVEPMRHFAGGNLKHLIALTITYWLIILPYLAYYGLEEVIGQERMHELLHARNN